ncbi:MAG: GNAT family N-acetyltransferase [Ruminococcus sp.]|nr:GNAT family N-acetyltransferase [Ruminococcus sp.]
MDLRIYLYDKLVSDARQLREEVFVQELCVENEFDDKENKSVHVIIYDGREPVAYARLCTEDGMSVIDHVCVKKEYRLKKLGRRAVAALEEDANKSGFSFSYAYPTHASEGFFEKIGYTPDISGGYKKEFKVKIKLH